MNLESAKQGWHNFWFAEQSTLPVSLFRIALGLCILQSCVYIYPDLFTWFGDLSWTPTEWSPPAYISLWKLLPPGDTSVLIVFWTLVVAASCFTLGFLTKVSTVVVWLCLMSASYANPFVANSGDSLMRICTFFLIFAPCGKSLSLDRLWLNRQAPTGGLVDQTLYSPWAQRLIQVQVACVYWQAFWGKIHGPHWLDGTAIYYVTHLSELQRIYLPQIFDNLWMCKILTWATLLFEVCLWSLIWLKPCRYYILLLGVALHAGIELTLNIPVFEILMVATYILFVDGEDLNSWAGKLRQLSQRFLPIKG